MMMKAFVTGTLLAGIIGLMGVSPVFAESWTSLFSDDDEYIISSYTLDEHSVSQQGSVVSYWVRLKQAAKDEDELGGMFFDNHFQYQSDCQADQIRVLKNRDLESGKLIDYEKDRSDIAEWAAADTFSLDRKLQNAICSKYYRR
jgi:hypothetical protein